MADVTADLILINELDGYQNGLEESYNGNQIPSNIISALIVSTVIPLLIPTIRDTVPGPTTITYYLMRARDPDCGPITYRFWVTNTPDPLAAQYSGARCGANPLVDIVIDRQWTVATS